MLGMAETKGNQKQKKRNNQKKHTLELASYMPPITTIYSARLNIYKHISAIHPVGQAPNAAPRSQGAFKGLHLSNHVAEPNFVVTHWHFFHLRSVLKNKTRIIDSPINDL